MVLEVVMEPEAGAVMEAVEEEAVMEVMEQESEPEEVMAAAPAPEEVMDWIVEMLWQRQRELPDQLAIQKIQIIPQSQKLLKMQVPAISTTSASI